MAGTELDDGNLGEPIDWRRIIMLVLAVTVLYALFWALVWPGSPVTPVRIAGVLLTMLLLNVGYGLLITPNSQLALSLFMVFAVDATLADRCARWLVGAYRTPGAMETPKYLLMLLMITAGGLILFGFGCLLARLRWAESLTQNNGRG